MLALAAWIKFYNQIETAIVMTGILGASLAFYLGAQGRWAKHIISDKASSAASDRVSSLLALVGYQVQLLLPGTAS